MCAARTGPERAWEVVWVEGAGSLFGDWVLVRMVSVLDGVERVASKGSSSFADVAA